MNTKDIPSHSKKYWAINEYKEIKRALSLNPYNFRRQQFATDKFVGVCFVCRRRTYIRYAFWFSYDDPRQESNYSIGINTCIDICTKKPCLIYAHFISGV